MNIQDFYQNFTSDSVAGSANQLLSTFEESKRFTGRVSYKLTQGGAQYALLYSNCIDSTYSDGSISKANDVGNPWIIHSLKVGLSAAHDVLPVSWIPVTFDGELTKKVEGPISFATDAIFLNAKADEYLHLEMDFEGTRFPYHEEILLDVQVRNDNGIFESNKKMPVPLMIGCDRKVEKKIGFIGDSITQGIGTEMESYEHWVADITKMLPKEVSVWDLGIGYARGQDAATNSYWLSRAKTCDEVNVCFGVNDIFHDRTANQIVNDLRTIITELQKAGCRVTIFTVPPFDYAPEFRPTWRAINESIRTDLRYLADDFFDFAKILGKPAPEEYLAPYGGHPNAEGSRILAQAYIAHLKT